MENAHNPFADYFKESGPTFPYTLTTADDGTQVVLVCFPKQFLSMPDNRDEANRKFLQDEVQKCADSQKIEGKVLIVWELDGNKLGYLSPTTPALRHLLGSLTSDFFATRVSGRIAFPC